MAGYETHGDSHARVLWWVNQIKETIKRLPTLEEAQAINDATDKLHLDPARERVVYEEIRNLCDSDDKYKAFLGLLGLEDESLTMDKFNTVFVDYIQKNGGKPLGTGVIPHSSFGPVNRFLAEVCNYSYRVFIYSGEESPDDPEDWISPLSPKDFRRQRQTFTDISEMVVTLLPSSASLRLGIKCKEVTDPGCHYVYDIQEGGPPELEPIVDSTYLQVSEEGNEIVPPHPSGKFITGRFSTLLKSARFNDILTTPNAIRTASGNLAYALYKEARTRELLKAGYAAFREPYSSDADALYWFTFRASLFEEYGIGTWNTDLRDILITHGQLTENAHTKATALVAAHFDSVEAARVSGAARLFEARILPTRESDDTSAIAKQLNTINRQANVDPNAAYTTFAGMLPQYSVALAPAANAVRKIKKRGFFTGKNSYRRTLKASLQEIRERISAERTVSSFVGDLDILIGLADRQDTPPAVLYERYLTWKTQYSSELANLSLSPILLAAIKPKGFTESSAAYRQILAKNLRTLRQLLTQGPPSIEAQEAAMSRNVGAALRDLPDEKLPARIAAMKNVYPNAWRKHTQKASVASVASVSSQSKPGFFGRLFTRKAAKVGPNRNVRAEAAALKMNLNRGASVALSVEAPKAKETEKPISLPPSSGIQSAGRRKTRRNK